MSRTANSRRFAATTLRKLRRQPADAGLVEHGGERLAPARRRVNTGLRTSRAQIGAFGEQRVEAVEIGSHRVDGVAASSASSNSAVA